MTMRLVFKILLFPISLALTIITLVCQFICTFSTAVLSVISGLLFVVAVLTLILLKDPAGALPIAIMAFVISPFGLPFLLQWVVNLMEGLNDLIKSI